MTTIKNCHEVVSSYGCFKNILMFICYRIILKNENVIPERIEKMENLNQYVPVSGNHQN